MENKKNLKMKLVIALVVFASIRTSVFAAYETLLNENWDSYAVNAYPTHSGWGLGGGHDNYERWPDNRVVSGGPSGSGNCMQITNPYNGWGMYVQKAFNWNPQSYDKLRIEVKYMYPNINSHESGNGVDIKLLRDNDLACALAIHLDTTQANGSDELGIWATNGNNHLFISPIGKFDQWMHIAAEVDIDTGIYNLWANGTLIGESLSTSLNVDLRDVAVFHCGKGFYDRGSGYFDDILVQGVSVPEPCTIALLGLGGILLRKKL